MNRLPPVKRESELTRKSFPFELLHTDGPANNMRSFHWHDFMELSYVRKGRGTYEIEDKVFPVAAGDIVIINNIERHRVSFDPSDPLYETVMHFRPELLSPQGSPPEEDDRLDSRYMRLFHYDGASFANKPELGQDSRRAVRQLVVDIRREYERRLPWFELLIKSRLLTLIALLLRESGRSEASAGGGAVDPRGLAQRRGNIRRLERILAYMSREYASRVSLQGIASRFAMSPSYFSDYFHRNLGITFREHLMRVRVQEAARLLADENRKVIDVAYSCGFRTPASFYQAFRKVTGSSPREFRHSSGT